MELRQIGQCIGVSEAGSLLKAAARLHIAQPALGQEMAALEQEQGVRLFDRSSRGVTLTEAGRVFLAHERIVLADAERARQAVRETTAQPSGDVVVGLPTTLARALAMPQTEQRRERYPQLRMQVIEAYSGFLGEWLLAGRLDLALLFGDGPDPVLSKCQLLEECLVLVTARGTGRVPRSLALADVVRWPLVLPGPGHGLRRIIDDASTPLGLQLQVVAQVDSLSSVKKAVAAGIGATILSVASVAKEVAAGQLQATMIGDASRKRRVVGASSVTRPVTLAAAAVMALAIELVRDMVRSKSWPATWIGEDKARA